MKISSITIITLSLLCSSLSLHAEVLSSCQSSCYKAKTQCNTLKSHTLNTCDHDLFTCKASCNSGKPEETYGISPIQVSVKPIFDFAH